MSEKNTISQKGPDLISPINYQNEGLSQYSFEKIRNYWNFFNKNTLCDSKMILCVETGIFADLSKGLFFNFLDFGF